MPIRSPASTSTRSDWRYSQDHADTERAREIAASLQSIREGSTLDPAPLLEEAREIAERRARRADERRLVEAARAAVEGQAAAVAIEPRIRAAEAGVRAAAPAVRDALGQLTAAVVELAKAERALNSVYAEAGRIRRKYGVSVPVAPMNVLTGMHQNALAVLRVMLDKVRT